VKRCIEGIPQRYITKWLEKAVRRPLLDEAPPQLGLDHYEGRGWRGFHHHMALCVAAYGFLVSERSLIPPSDNKTLFIQASRLSPGYRPRGSADPSRTPHQSVNRNHTH
jgi:hypothetical protein